MLGWQGRGIPRAEKGEGWLWGENGWVVGWLWGGGLWGKSIHCDRHGGAAIGLSHLSTSHYPLLGNVKQLILDFLEIHDGFCKLTSNIENAILKLKLMIQIRTNWTDQNQGVLCFQYIWWMFPNLHILPEAGARQLSFIALQHLPRPDWNTTRMFQGHGLGLK